MVDIAHGCGPLSLAVLSNDLAKAEYFLERDPDMLRERNSFGQSALHLACNKPLCLKLILRYAKRELLDDVDTMNETALQWALKLSGDHCENGTAALMCSQCGCAEATAVLLEAGSSLSYRFYRDLQHIFQKASQRCKQTFAEQLKKRRDELKALAVDHLSDPEIQDMGLHKGSVPDGVVPQIASLLQRRGVVISPALYLPLGDEDDTAPAYPIYQTLRSDKDADIFFRLGFRDTNLSFWDDGRTWRIWPPMYLQWLSQRGADVLFKKLHISLWGDGLFAAHFTCSKFGECVSYKGHWSDGPASYGLNDDWVHEVHIVAISAAMADACRCKCSISGCLPYNFLIAGIHRKFLTILAWETFTTMVFINSYLHVFGPHLQIAHHYAALRYMTYSVLGLPHICCYEYAPTYRRSFSEEEVNEIHSEHAECLDLLEELLEEFEGQVDVIFSSRPANQRLPDIVNFWKFTWIKRMKGVLEQLEGNSLSEEEKARAERLGVVWDSETPGEDSQPLTENPYEYTGWEYWYYELDKIAV